VKQILWTSLIALTAASSLCSVSQAQESASASRISIEAFSPEFKAEGYSFPTSAWFVTLHESVEGPVHVEMQIPAGYVEQHVGPGIRREMRLANPYVGISWTSPENPASLGLGMRFPVLPNDAYSRVMRVADIHRFEAFVPDLWDFSFHSAVGDETTPLRARMRAHLWVPLHGSMEVVADYAFGVQRLASIVLLRLEVLGRAGITGDNLIFGERSMHQAGLTIQVITPGVRPSVVLRAPIGGREVVDWVVGAGISF